MTEFGDRIKAYRANKQLTQPEACLRLFPIKHKDSNYNSRNVWISQIENGHSVMSESAPDFINVMRELRLEETELLKMLHAGQKEIRAAKEAAKEARSKSSSASATFQANKAIDDALAGLAPLAPAADLASRTGEKRPVGRPPGRKTTRRPFVAVAKNDAPRLPTVGESSAASAVEALVGDLSVVMQKRSASTQVRAIHHQTLGEFVKRVASVTLIVSRGDTSDIGALAEDLSHVMQKRAASEHIRRLPHQALGDFAKQMVTAAVKLQERA